MADELESHLGPPSVSSLDGEPSSARERIVPPPQAVLDAARRREPAALAAFFDVYFGHVYSFAARLLGDRAAAEDLAQEVFLKVHRALDRLDPTRDPWPWLATIIQNACRDRWRSGAHRMARGSASIDGDPGAADRLRATGDGPEANAIARERERIVREAIAMLPEAQREMVLLFDYGGLSHVEVAEALGISHAAARKRYSRALEELGRILRRTMER